MSLENKVALVAGGTSGIGRSSVIALAKAGCKVVFCGRREKEAQETIMLAEKSGHSVEFIKADISQEKEVKFLLDKIVATYGKLDIAFNNAAIYGKNGPYTAMTVEEYDDIFNINVKGVFLLMKHEIIAMLKNGSGSIINNSSVLGLTALSEMAFYTASKHAIIGLTKSVALEYAKQHIRANIIAPGPTDAPMFFDSIGHLESEKAKFVISTMPVGRIGKAEEIAEAVVFLASPASSLITGHTLVVDGGYIVQ